MNAQLRAALELAEQQLVALELGDSEAYFRGAEAHEAACVALTTILSREDVGQEDAALLEQLVSTNQLVSARLTRAMQEISNRLAAMSRGREATNAYQTGWTNGISGVREA